MQRKRLTSTLLFALKVKEQTLSSGASVKMTSTLSALCLALEVSVVAPPKCFGSSDFSVKRACIRK